MLELKSRIPYGIEADVSIILRDGYAVLVIDDFTFEVRPTSTGAGVWRKCPGLNVGIPFIVRHLVRVNDRTFDRRPFTEDDIRHLESFVDCLKDIILGLNAQLKGYCEQQFKKAIIRARQRDERQQESHQGKFVYLFRHANGLTKIGFSKDPRKREQTLQAEDPRVNILAVKSGLQSLETRLHAIYSDKRVRGEWFDLTDNDISWLFMLVGFSVDIDTVCGSDPLSATEKTARTRQLSE